MKAAELREKTTEELQTLLMEELRNKVNRVIILIDNSPKFNYTLNSQLIRSAISIGSNIAEGSEKTNKDFCRFLDIAIGSINELQFQIQFYTNTNEIRELSNMIKAKCINFSTSMVHIYI